MNFPYQFLYHPPAGFSNIIMQSDDGTSLTGLWFENSRSQTKHSAGVPKDLPVFRETIRWLDIYFTGKAPDFMPRWKIQDATSFRREVLEELCAIPFGGLVTYNDIAKSIARKRGIARMSAQAVGGAVGWNPLCIIIPCHRVVGAENHLTGYGGGIQNKAALLELEGHRMRNWVMPKKK